MKKKTSSILKYILSAGVAAILMYFSFREVKWEDFMESLRQCRWEFIAISMAAGTAAFWFRGVRWRQLLIPIDPQTKRITTFNAVNIGYLANFVFPRIGEFVRCGVISRRFQKASYDKVLGTVVLERGWDMLSMLFLLIVLLIGKWDRFGDFFLHQMWEPISQRISLSIWWIIAIMAVIGGSAIFLIWKLKDHNRICGKIWNLILGILQGFSSCFAMDGKWRFFVTTAAIWGMYWLMAVATTLAIPALDGLNVIDALFLSLAGSLGWLIPVPGGFGAFHFIVSLALQAIYGVPFELGIVFATLSHESQAITMAVFGGGSYVYETLKSKN